MAMFGALSRLSMTATTWLAQVDTRPGASGAAPVAGAAGKPAPSGTEGSGWTQIVLMLVFFAVFYFLVLRPQSQRAKKHKAFLDSLQVGSRVVLANGLFGKVTALEGIEAKVEIADRVVVRVLRSQIAGLETNAAEAVADANPQK